MPFLLCVCSCFAFFFSVCALSIRCVFVSLPSVLFHTSRIFFFENLRTSYFLLFSWREKRTEWEERRNEKSEVTGDSVRFWLWERMRMHVQGGQRGGGGHVADRKWTLTPFPSNQQKWPNERHFLWPPHPLTIRAWESGRWEAETLFWSS